MCIIAYKPADKEISKETLQTCWNKNSDGAGYMYNVNGKLKIKRGFFDFDSFYSSYKHSTEGKKSVIHFRIATHGAIDEENCHPFKVNNSLGFVHNGIISTISQEDKKKSDTWHFNEKILKPITSYEQSLFGNNAVCELIRGYIGHSKLVFMDDKDDVFILNEKMGEWHEGCWYSNPGYKTYTHNVVPYTPKVAKYTHQQGGGYNKIDQKYNGAMVQGEMICLTADYKGLPKGMIGQISSINRDFTANIECYNKEYDVVFIRNNIPFHVIDILSAEILYNGEEYYGGV